MEYVTIECMNPKPHAPHTWREGFLWHRKRECKGWIGKSAWLRKNHRHNLIFDRQASDVLFMHWACDVLGCDQSHTRMRRDFNWETVGLPKVRERALTVVYKKQKI